MSPAAVTCILAFFLAAIITYVATPFSLRLAIRCGAVRLPRPRDVHVGPMPLWGGAAIYVGALIPPLLALHGIVPPAMAGILLGATVIAVFGMLDDRVDIPAIGQAAVIVAAGLVAALMGARVDFVTDPRGGMIWLGKGAVLAAVAWIFLVTKAVDMVDGLDGLAAGISAIAGASLALMGLGRHQPELAVWAAALSGACVGFLRYNFSPATIFMGTVGAQFLGFMLAGLSIVGPFKMAAAVTLILPILVLGVPVLDAVRVVLVRVAKGRPASAAARDHVHHILLRRWGLSQRATVVVLYITSAALSVVALFIFAQIVR